MAHAPPVVIYNLNPSGEDSQLPAFSIMLPTDNQLNFGLEVTPKEVIIRVRFDPSTCEDLADIFSNPATRAVWALIKRDHISSQHFDGAVRTVGQRITAKPPKDIEDLQKLLLMSGDNAVSYPWKVPDDLPRSCFGGGKATAAYVAKARIYRHEKMQLLLDCITGVKILTLKYEENM